MADNTGGSRAGVFESAIPMVNALGPAFVLSIGDLADGYTEDQGVIDGQWSEFEAFIGRVGAPFARVPDNRDARNDFLAEGGRRRFGQAHFLFFHNDVPKRNARARWTFVVVHCPPWDHGNRKGFEHLELPASRRWVIDWIREIPRASGGEIAWVSVPHPGLVQEDWDWKGTSDLLLEHVVEWDDEHLVVQARTRDDVVHEMPGKPATAQMDKFLVRLRDESGADIVDAQIATGSRVAGKLPDGATFECEAIDGGIEATLRIPHAALDGPGGEAWQRLRLAIGTMDVDRPENTKPSVIWTSPPFGHWADHEGTGSYRRIGM